MKLATWLIAIILTTSQAAFAATVTQVKGSNVLISLDGDSAKSGEEFFIVSAGKRVGIIKIKTVKGGKAIGTLTKGRATVGSTLQARSSAKASTPTPTASSPRIQKRKSSIGVGVLLGFSQNTMSLTAQNPDSPSDQEDVTLKGNSFSAKGFFDYDFSPSLTFRGAVGLEPFSGKGSISQNICSDGTSTSCEATFNYIAFEGSAHYNFTTSGTRYWAGLGYSFLMEMSKSINIPNLQSEGKTNQVLLFGGGADFMMGNGFVPVVIEYGMFPGSSNVTANAIYIRGGYGFFW